MKTLTKNMSAGVIAGVLSLAACAKVEKGIAVTQPLQGESEAVQYFSKFLVSKGIPLIGPSEFLRSRVIQLTQPAEGKKAVYFQVSLLLEENRHYILEYREVADEDPNDNKAFGVLSVPPVLEGQWLVNDTKLVLKDQDSNIVATGTAATNAGKNIVALVINKDFATPGVKGEQMDLFFQTVARSLPLDLRDLHDSSPKETGTSAELND